MNAALDDTLRRLYALRRFGLRPGLESVQALLERLGHPERACAVIHIAGTNGKGSVAAMLDAVLRAAGLRVGLYTSPHLVRFNERIRVNGVAITDDALASLFAGLEPHLAALAGTPGREATFFEVTTALAFQHFADAGVRLVVMETGLGGRLDATNVAAPLASVITRIGLDHMQYLGATLEEIAGEKAGIIKAGRPVVLGAMPAAARAVVAAAAQRAGARLVEASAVVTVRRVSETWAGQKVSLASLEQEYGTVTVPLLGRHQLENLATVLTTLETLAVEGLPAVAPAVLRKGLAAVRWPGRMQVLETAPPTILDGAHNPDAAHALSVALHDLLKGRPVALLFGMCEDKDAAGFLRALDLPVRKVWTVPLSHPRGQTPGALAALVRARGWPVDAAQALPDALAAARVWAAAEGAAVVICGSLFLAGDVLALREGSGHVEQTN
ncbi:MAG: folylpolyglutamate synthase/dihydrofolate synthase family protein [bacterium]